MSERVYFEINYSHKTKRKRAKNTENDVRRSDHISNAMSRSNVTIR